VEFAVVAPVFFLLVFGMIEFGRMVMVQQIITNASREGARLAVLDAPAGVSKHDEVVTTVENYLADAGINGATVDTDPSEPSTAQYGDPVTVTVTVPFDQVSWLPTPLFIGGQNLVATTVMRRETVQ
jgi:Flp pilus assembly protein TadG